MAMVNGHRMLAAEFYDTPASHKAPGGGKPADANRFRRNGTRPE